MPLKRNYFLIVSEGNVTNVTLMQANVGKSELPKLWKIPHNRTKNIRNPAILHLQKAYYDFFVLWFSYKKILMPSWKSLWFSLFMHLIVYFARLKVTHEFKALINQHNMQLK